MANTHYIKICLYELEKWKGKDADDDKEKHLVSLETGWTSNRELLSSTPNSPRQHQTTDKHGLSRPQRPEQPGHPKKKKSSPIRFAVGL